MPHGPVVKGPNYSPIDPFPVPWSNGTFLAKPPWIWVFRGPCRAAHPWAHVLHQVICYDGGSAKAGLSPQKPNNLNTMADQTNKPTDTRQQTAGTPKPGSDPKAQNKEQTPGQKTKQPEASDRVGGDAERTQANKPQGSSTQKPTEPSKPKA